MQWVEMNRSGKRHVTKERTAVVFARKLEGNDYISLPSDYAIEETKQYCYKCILSLLH